MTTKEKTSPTLDNGMPLCFRPSPEERALIRDLLRLRNHRGISHLFHALLRDEAERALGEGGDRCQTPDPERSAARARPRPTAS